MPISIISVDKAIKNRAYAFYRSARLIIEYSNNTKPKIYSVCMQQLNSAIDYFLNSEQVSHDELGKFIANIYGIIIYHGSSVGLKLTIEDAIRNLSHAEHLYNWLFRDKSKIDTIYNVISNSLSDDDTSSDKYLHTIEHIPLSQFNKSIQKEWLKILLKSQSQPNWFAYLPQWEKNILLDFVNLWVNRKKLLSDYVQIDSFSKLPENIQQHLNNVVSEANNAGKLNDLDLGSFLGMQTGHLAHYPSIRNGYKILTCLYRNSNDENKLTLIRKSSSMRTAIPVTHIDNHREMIRVTIANILQAILFDISSTIIKIYNQTPTGPIFVPILLQSLGSQHSIYNDHKTKIAMQDAIVSLRKKFSSKKVTASFLHANAKQILNTINRDTLISDPKSILKDLISNERVVIDFCFSVHDVITGSFLKNKTFPFTTDRNEHNHLLNILKKGLTNLISRSIIIDGTPLLKSDVFQGALKKHISTNDPISAFNEIRSLSLNNIIYEVPDIKIGVSAYKMYLNESKNSFKKAAFLVIAFSSFGLRIGGCSNGCDIESPLTLIINSLRLFYTNHGHFPKYSNDHKKEEQEFNNYVASELLKGYCHNSLEFSSQGCSGLTYLDKTLGNYIKENLVKLYDKHGIDPEIDIYDNSKVISLLESIGATLDIKKFTPYITATIDRLHSLDKPSSFNPDSCKIINLPEHLKSISKKRHSAEEALHKKLKKDIFKNFQILNYHDLVNTTNYEKKSSPLKGSANRIQNFRIDFIKSMYNHPKDEE